MAQADTDDNGSDTQLTSEGGARLSVAVPSDSVDHIGQAPVAPFGQSPQFVERCRVRAVVLGPGDQLPTVDREGQPIEHVTETVGGISFGGTAGVLANIREWFPAGLTASAPFLGRIGRPTDSTGNCTAPVDQRAGLLSASRAVISDRRNLRCPPRVRMNPRRPESVRPMVKAPARRPARR